MNKVKFLQSMVVALVLLNVVILGLILGPRLMSPKGGGIQKHFSFNTEQVAEFEKSRDQIREKMRALNPQLIEASREYYLSSERNPKGDQLLAQISKINESIYKVHYKHFRDIENICDEEQVKLLPEFVSELMKNKPRDRRR